MSFLASFINSYMFASVMLTAFYAMYALAKKRSKIHMIFAMICLCITIYIFGYMMEINSYNIEQMIFWNRVQYLTIPFFTSLWLLFAIEYCQNKLRNSRIFSISILIIPIITFIIRQTNDFHLWYYNSINVKEFFDFKLLALGKGPWYFIHVIYLTITLLIASGLFISKLRNSSSNKKVIFGLIILITYVPYFGVIANLFNFGNVYVDYNAFFIPIMSLLLFSVLFSNDILRIKAYARDRLFENSKNGILLVNTSYEIIDYNNALKASLNEVSDKLIGCSMEDLFSQKEELIDAVKSKQKKQIDIETPSGLKHFYVTTSEILSNSGKLSGYSVMFNDISEIVHLAANLDEEKNLLKATLLSVGDGVITTDYNGKISLMNPIAELLTGWRYSEAKVENLDEVFKVIKKEATDENLNLYSEVMSNECAIEYTNNIYLIARNNKAIPIETSAAPIKDNNGKTTGVVVVFRDYSEKKKRQDMVEYLSFHDQLTGIYNRRYFENYLKEVDNPSNLPLCIIMADVNGLKLTNDAFGHSLGDLLLKSASNAILSQIVSTDVFCRVGGDEFVIIMPKSDETRARNIINTINEALSKLSVGDIEMSISFGYSIKDAISDSVDDTYKKAEDMMYQNKLVDSPLMREKTISKIVHSLYDRIPGEKEHSLNVFTISEKIAKNADLTSDQIKDLHYAAKLHDIGKIVIDFPVIFNDRKLTEKEWTEVKRHSEYGYRILSSSYEFSRVSEIVLLHHENYDGTGYPKGIAGENIPIQARIIRIADSYDAMINNRPYRDALSKEYAKDELIKNKGSLYDPKLVDIFISMIDTESA